MMKTLTRVAAVALTGAWIATPLSARPAPTNQTALTATVRYDDLDLSSAKDRGKLIRRISSTAYQLCRDLSGVSSLPPPADPTCFNQSMKDALEQMSGLIVRTHRGPIVAEVPPISPRP